MTMLFVFQAINYYLCRLDTDEENGELWIALGMFNWL